MGICAMPDVYVGFGLIQYSDTRKDLAFQVAKRYTSGGVT
jgi:hypothetical protein